MGNQSKFIRPLDAVKYTATIEPAEYGFTVRATIVDHGCDIPLDRADALGYGVISRNVAERLARAIEAGAVFHSHELRVDVNGKTYVSSRARVLGRTANADLRRLGY